MIKKVLTLLTLLCAGLSAAAGVAGAAWQLTAKINNVGGSLTVRGGAPVTGTFFKTYTTSQNIPVVVTANTGYSISSIAVNGATVTPTPVSPATFQMGLQTYPAVASQTVSSYFVKQLFPVTAVAGTGGVVSPSGTANLQYGSTANYTFTPNVGKQVRDITGLPPGATLTDTTTATAVTLPAPIDHPVKATFTVPAYSVTITGTFLPIVANAGAGQTVLIGSTVTLNGSATPPEGASYYWTQTAGPTVTLSSPTAQAPNFFAALTGTLNFSLTASNLYGSNTAATYVNVTDSPATAARAQCMVCHVQNGVGIASNVFGNWSASLHRANFVMCAKCHVGADSGNHPGPVVTDNVCKGCHVDGSGTVPNHLYEIGTNSCVTSLCHNPHSTNAGGYSNSPPHFNNITTGMYPASFLTSRATCTDCHVTTANNQLHRQQWETSRHADIYGPGWIQYDFKTLPGCVRCHTTTGFVAYSSGRVTAAWGDAADKTKELLTCRGCHQDMSIGLLRTLPPIAPWPDDTYTNPEMGKSNVCVRCHVGTRNGKSITAQLDALADFTNLPFIDPHYAAVAGNLFGQTGYHFPGQSYASASTHSSIGSSDGNGPCVTCHKNPVNGHDFAPIGVITLCANCHGSSLDTPTLSADRIAFLNALEVLRAQLAAKGFVYTGAAPYFTNTNWGTGQNGANTMGAAFNYVLLVTEPGIYAHNRDYARQLVLDSIDYLDNAQLDDSVTTLAVPTLLGSGAITQGLADNMTTYKAKNSCTICHGYTAASGIPMATNSHGTHLTGTYGPANYLGTDFGACQTCHTYSTATHPNGSVDVVTGAGTACTNCHAGLEPPWSGSGRLNCTACHAAVPSVLPNAVAAPYKENFNTTGHGLFGVINDCTTCHDPDSNHITGSLGDSKRLRLPNDNNLCASCHNDPAKVGAEKLNMITHVSLACRDCHDPHGTTNLSMIRATINVTPITYTDSVNGLVDTVTNLGLCQVCHTSTAHYRAGVPESGHFTFGCLTCHTHNAAGGAFRPTGGNCDSCHGYPPAPRNPVVAFGTMNNWSSARFEDYSGGGGAHLVAAHISPNAKPSEGWANCTICHNSGNTQTAPYHQMVTPVKDHVDNVTIAVDPRYRFSNDYFISYTGAKLLNGGANKTGSCFNVSCHFTTSPRWSIER